MTLHVHFWQSFPQSLILRPVCQLLFRCSGASIIRPPPQVRVRRPRGSLPHQRHGLGDQAGANPRRGPWLRYLPQQPWRYSMGCPGHLDTALWECTLGTLSQCSEWECSLGTLSQAHTHTLPCTGSKDRTQTDTRIDMDTQAVKLMVV